MKIVTQWVAAHAGKALYRLLADHDNFAIERLEKDHAGGDKWREIKVWPKTGHQSDWFCLTLLADAVQQKSVPLTHTAGGVSDAVFSGECVDIVIGREISTPK